MSNIPLMFYQGSVLFAMSASVLARLLKQDLNHQLCLTRLKQSVNAPHTLRFWPTQDIPKVAEVWLNLTAAEADVSLATNRNAA